MTSKERAKLKSIASNMDTILQIGKNPIGDTFLKQVKDALKAREMIKIHVLETCELTPFEAANALAEAAECEVVQVIGSKVILFKQRKRDDKKGSYLDKDTKTGSGVRSSKGSEKAVKKTAGSGRNGKTGRLGRSDGKNRSKKGKTK